MSQSTGNAEEETTPPQKANRAPESVERVTSDDNLAAPTVSSASKPEKDKWDKIAAMAPIISGVFLFSAGGVFTYTYNQQQLKLQEIQTIEKFIPHLTGSEQSKKAAILAINSLADAKLAGKIASIYASSGTVSALQTMTRSGDDKDREIAQQALDKTLESLKARESRLDDMESEYRKVLQGSDSSEADTPENLIGMAVTYKTTGQYALSEQLLKRALTIIEWKNGAESAEAAYIWRKLADLNSARGNRAQSETCQKRALAIEAKVTSSREPAQDAAPPENSSSLPQPEKEADVTPKDKES
ncbi:MAG: tetratricopeptide repeat protein [Candidatus Melainabacteria bacterium]|nr:tetratricopeptide repeat protein [Candidatus Melainabacteria bacterium]